MGDIDTIDVGGARYVIHDLRRLGRDAGVELAELPYVARVLLEATLRAEGRAKAIAFARAVARGEGRGLEIAFVPARLLFQDYTGVPSLVDLAALRDRVAELGGDPARVRPVVATDLVVDHAIQSDFAGTRDALARNEALEMRRNAERYSFLRWAEQALDDVRVSPPGEGIVHQVNLERLVSLVVTKQGDGGPVLIPDTVIGTDSHSTMANGLGVLGWGVGGLEAEAILLGVPVPMVLPPIVGLRLDGRLRAGVTATDVVLALTEFLRAAGVVGALLEVTGPAVTRLSAPDRCTIANMAPEYGAMCTFFQVDAETLRYLRHTGHAEADVARAEAFLRHQWLFREPGDPTPRFERLLEFRLDDVEPSVAGPRAPHQRVPLARLGESFRAVSPAASMTPRADGELAHGAIAIAAITSCTSTSNPASMIAAGLLARRALERGLTVPAHVKTSFSPGSRAVTRYLESAGLIEPLEGLGFHVVGYGCMTCNGGSGDLAPRVADAVTRDGLVLASVLSGNRNFEGRIHPLIRANYLASPPLVVALAIAGRVDIDPTREPLGVDGEGRSVFLSDLWPGEAEIARLVGMIDPGVFLARTGGSSAWSDLPFEPGARYRWSEASTYIRKPPYFDAVTPAPGAITGARALLALGDDITTDHISPVGAIPAGSDVGRYLASRGVAPSAFNSHGSRRGNHEVMARATFANERLRNHLLPGVEGGFTVHQPTRERLTVFEAASRYAEERTPLVILAGRNYGMGSSRDWAARGPWFLGVRAVLARSFERIHRANLVAMGILPLELPAAWGELGLEGRESFAISLPEAGPIPGGPVRVTARRDDGREIAFDTVARIASDGERAIYARGGMLPYILDRLTDRAAGERQIGA